MNTIKSAINAAVPPIEQYLGMPMPLNETLFRRMVLDELVKLGIPAMRLETEYPHPKIRGKRVDAAILGDNGVPEVATEFKYHRRNPQSDTNHSEKAGELLKDFARLRDFPNVQRLVVYLTDDEMLKYFKNKTPERDLKWLLDPRNEQEISDAKIPNIKTLRAKAGDWTRPALSQMLLNRTVASDHRLIVWQVRPEPQGD